MAAIGQKTDWCLILSETLSVEIDRNSQPICRRPWQHVLESISGYVLLAQRLYQNGNEYSEAWNFGPVDEDAQLFKKL